MTLHKILSLFKEQNKPFTITFGESLSITCRILELHEDVLKVNKMAFNKTEKSFTATPYNYFIPIGAILFIEEPGN